VESLSEVSKLCGRYYSNSNLNEFSFIFFKKKVILTLHGLAESRFVKCLG
jgi:hypothetical protein